MLMMIEGGMKSHEIRVTPKGRNLYPFKRMAIGDWFWLCSDVVDSADRSACQLSRRNGGKFTFKIADGNRHLCWRVE